ncbi:MAG: T9SS type A sorting domain-containing protein [Flavobacteriaceae bacterium]|nr:T9SS type A sorting domain-containing protein [Flavobacteriaceae bacterium]
MKKRLLVLFVLGLLTNTEIFGQIFTENFDGTWNSPAPTGWASDREANNARAWHRNDYTTYWASPAVGSPIASGAESTNYYARFHSSTVNSGITAFIYYNSNINLSTYCAVQLSFYYINPTGLDELDVYFSNDGGYTYSLIQLVQNSSQWKKFTIDIPSAYLVNNFRIGFVANSDNGNDDMGIDQIVIEEKITPVDITNSNTNICSGALQSLVATGGNLKNETIFSENFNSGLPGTWTAINNSTGGTPANAAWTNRADGYSYGGTPFHSNDNTSFMMSNSDVQGLFGTTNTELITPSINLTNYTSAVLYFNQYFAYFSGETAKVQISVNGGAYSDLITYNATVLYIDYFALETINLSAYIGNSDIKLKFKYNATFDYYWAIDNVKVMGNKQKITWTPTTNLYTDSGLTTPYVSGNHAATVYASPSATTTYTATSAIGSCSKTDTVTLTVETAVYNGTWTPALSSNQSIEINADYTLATDMDVCACKINSGKKLTVPSATTLTVQNGIDNAGEIVVDHTGSLVQVNETDTNTGAGVYKIKKTTGTYKNYDYFYWSSPVENETVGTVLPTVNYKYKFNPANYLDVKSGHGYPQPTASIPGDGYDDNGDDWSYLSNSTIMPKGIGFIAMGKDSPTSFSVGQMGVSQAAFDVTFEGEKIHNGTFTAEVKQDAYNVSPGYNPNNNNLNLLGNPYPSAIDVFELYHDNASVLEGKFYFWTHDAQLAAISGPNAYDFDNNNFAIGAVTGTYPSYTYTQTLSGTGKSAPRYIASTQGFMASAIDGIASTSNVTYKNSMRATGNNNTFFRQASDIPQVSRLWLNMTGANSFNQIAVGFDISTSDTYGMGDAPRVASAANTDFYSIIQEVNGAFAIQFLSDFQDDKMVPLGISVLNQGTFEISLDHADGIFTEGQKIYLEDTYEDVIHNLNEGAYSFTQTAGTNINDRFILRFTNTALGNDDTALNTVKVYPNPSTGVFNVSYQGSATLQYTVYDLTGKTILSGTGNQIDLSHQAIGMYFATITDGSALRSLKLVRE